ncbi:MAG: hypothetical protein Kow0027_15260 [Saprospiraceae bacterium]
MPKLNEIKSKFKSLLKDDLKKAIQDIQESLKYESKFYNDFVIFHSQINELNRGYHIQIIPYDDYILDVNRIRNGVLKIVDDLTKEDLKDIKNEKDINQEKSETKQGLPPFKMIRHGEFLDKNGQYILTEAPTVFFSYRLARAFPGVRGLRWFKGEMAIKRLKLLLREPTRFDIANGYGVYTDPIWWFRGHSALPVERFTVLSHGKCLLNHKELKISKVAAYNPPLYYRCFVYVEVEGEQPIGLYHYTKKQIAKVKERRGYYDEEYGLLEGTPIKREEYDDGAAEINGEIVDASGAELRVRLLTSYNFIIAAKSSPFNSEEGNKLGDEFMNRILKGEKTLEEFAKKAEGLKKNWMDK